MISKFKPTLESSKYEGLITIFAIILTVEYSSEIYDLWDIFLGLLVIYIGIFKYWDEAKKKKDNFYYILTTNLIGLGILNFINSIISFGEKYSCLGDNINFGIFIVISLILYMIISIEKHTDNSNTPKN